MTGELKPVRCGCRGEARVVKHEYYMCSPTYGVTCYKCGTATNQGFDTEAEAVQSWNRAMSGSTEKFSTVERTAKATRKPEAFFYRCECGYGLCCEKNDMNYFPHCSGRLEWE